MFVFLQAVRKTLRRLRDYPDGGKYWRLSGLINFMSGLI
jgi:hypothetical protein